MKNKIIIATLDFKLVYKVKLSISDIFEIDHIMPSESYNVDELVITSPSDMKLSNNPKILIINRNDPIEKIKLTIITNFNKFNHYQNNITIGIDPGKSIGSCLLISNIIAETNVFFKISSLINWIKKLLQYLRIKNVSFKVGNGGGYYFDLIIKHLTINFTNQIEIVNEHNTSIKSDNSRSIHEQAAILIAKREGKLLDKFDKDS